MKYLRFDDKSTRSTRLVQDRFCIILEIWDKFIENSQVCYTPKKNLTIDEQLLPCKARCSFIQYTPSKSDKFCISFWLINEVESKYVLNGFVYLGSSDSRPKNECLGEYVVKELVQPFENIFTALYKGHCITIDNFFTTLNLSRNLFKKKNASSRYFKPE